MVVQVLEFTGLCIAMHNRFEKSLFTFYLKIGKGYKTRNLVYTIT